MKGIPIFLTLIAGWAMVHFPLFAQEQLLSYPEQWQFEKRSLGIILASDQQLIDLQDPDRKIELSTRIEPRWEVYA